VKIKNGIATVLVIAGATISPAFSQTSVNSVPVKPVTNKVENSGAAENKSASPSLMNSNNNKVKVIDRKNRKPAQVTTHRKPVQATKK
jgi:hypothetical protein